MDVRPVTVAETRPLRHAGLRPHETVDAMAAREREDAYAVGAFIDGALVGVGLIMADGSDRAGEGGRDGDRVIGAWAWGRQRGAAGVDRPRGDRRRRADLVQRADTGGQPLPAGG